MDRQNKSDAKEKVSGSGSSGPGSQSRRGGSSVYHPNFPPQFFPQMGFYNTQREALKSIRFDKDLETFNRPHDNVPPEMLKIILARKREIAKKYGWPCSF
ncbi:hypothetical protein HanHA300_Chr11g0397701 [Helianthus annuus]|nr:hypothetical protein HanHA300_Chr11g0397701 [Helianthus annuus]KAJ0508885.1 hypothetical protein HanIR_Chr11g0522361 [Helianthus annuus]KAJ0517065.1 hypothetical protein HanHA89_Chr11g0420991 [Helianthus annuus]KAJ0685074.1 hypothetical protein HanLR1_Chr11g0398411 [Helianthus annuus]KAJ0688992.1 hypothetical protein HanOQP8_Chr11g0400541 [Helianthus annuus]